MLARVPARCSVKSSSRLRADTKDSFEYEFSCRARGRWAPGAEALAAAARAVLRIASEGRSAEDALGAFEHSPERAAIRAITSGTVRWYLRLLRALEPSCSGQTALRLKCWHCS